VQVRRQVQGRQRSRLEVAEEVGHLQAEGGEGGEGGHHRQEVAAEAEEVGHLQAEGGEGGEGGHHRQKEAEAELSLQQGEQKL
jgi:hypothetical protein